MAEESRPIARQAVTPAAQHMAGRFRATATALVFLTIAGATIAIGSQLESKRHAPSIVGMVFLLAIFAGIPGVFTWRAYVKLRRCERIARAAQQDGNLSWHLAGKLLVAAEGDIPRPDLSFGVTRSLRTMLTAVPRATALAPRE